MMLKSSAILQSTWTASVLLSRAIVLEATADGPDSCIELVQTNTSNVVGKTCLELGCGTGLAGLTAINVGCEQCTFTDCRYSDTFDHFGDMASYAK